jgi:hypothetical protein
LLRSAFFFFFNFNLFNKTNGAIYGGLPVRPLLVACCVLAIMPIRRLLVAASSGAASKLRRIGKMGLPHGPVHVPRGLHTHQHQWGMASPGVKGGREFLCRI